MYIMYSINFIYKFYTLKIKKTLFDYMSKEIRLTSFSSSGG